MLASSLAYDLLQFLRDKLVAAEASKDSRAIANIQSTLDVLFEFADGLSYRGMGKILEILESSSRDMLTGIPGKASIPSDDEIRAAVESGPPG